jgi:hypothetical protein
VQREASRELDAQVAEKVMGLTVWTKADVLREMPVRWKAAAKVIREGGDWPEPARSAYASLLEGQETGMDSYYSYDLYTPPTEGCNEPEGLPRYSLDIAAAWEVVQRISGGHVGTYDGMSVGSTFMDGCRVEIYDSSPMGYVGNNGEEIPTAERIVVWADTAPLAICLAALDAVASVSGLSPQGENTP